MQDRTRYARRAAGNDWIGFMNKRVKRVFIVLIFLVPLLYFTWTIMFFSPFEESFGNIEYIIPRDVDFYVSKVDLDDDFDEFPAPRVLQELKVNREWREFQETAQFKELSGGKSIDDRLTEIRASIKDIPLDPLEDFLGREVAVAGTFGPPGKDNTFLAFFRGSWKAKFVFELMTWDFIRGMAPDPVIADSTAEFDQRGFITLVLADGQGTTFYLKRCTDLIIAGNDEKLIADVAELVDLGRNSIDLSLGGSQAFVDKITAVTHEGEELVDFHINLNNFFKRATFDDTLKANNIDFSVMTAMDMFNPDFFRDLTGTVNLEDSLVLTARSEINKQNVQEADEAGFFDQGSLELQAGMTELASMLPPDVFLAGCAKLRLQHFLTTLEKNLEPDLRTLINDLVREGGRHSIKWKLTGTWELIDYFDRMFGTKVYFALRPRAKDKPIIPFEQPLPSMALIFEIADPERLDLLEEVIINLQDNRRQAFDISQFKNDWYGCNIKILDPKGIEEELEVIAFTRMGGKHFVISTSSDFIREIVQAWARPEPRLELEGLDKYKRAAGLFPKHGNLAVYLEMEGFRGALRDYSVFWGHLQIEQTPEQVQAERQRVRQRVSRELGFAGRRELSQADEERLVETVDEEMLRLLEARMESEVPGHAAAFLERFVWLDLFRSFSIAVNVQPHSIDLGIQVETVLEK